MNAPFGIVVPEHLVPVVERLWRKGFRGVRKRPILVKWMMDAIHLWGLGPQKGAPGRGVSPGVRNDRIWKAGLAG